MAYRWGVRYDFLTTALIAGGGGIFSGITNSPTIASSKLVIGASVNATASVVLDSQATWIVNGQLSFDQTNSTAIQPIFEVIDGSTVQCGVYAKATAGILKLATYRGGASGTQIGSDSSSILTMDGATLYDIESKIFLNGSSSNIQVKVGGVEYLNVTGDFTNTANDFADIVRFGGTVSGNVVICRWVHATIMDGQGGTHNDFVGPLTSKTCFPTAEGNYSDFTPSTGTDNSALIDDATANADTDYNSSSTLDHKDSFVYQDVAATATGIIARSVWTNARRDDASTTKFKTLTRISSTDYVGTEHTVTLSYLFYGQHDGNSPATSTTWGISEFNGAEVGYRKTV